MTAVKDSIIRIRSSFFFCVGLILKNNCVQSATPLLNYMKKWSRDQVIRYCHKRGFVIEKEERYGCEEKEKLSDQFTFKKFIPDKEDCEVVNKCYERFATISPEHARADITHDFYSGFYCGCSWMLFRTQKDNKNLTIDDFELEQKLELLYRLFDNIIHDENLNSNLFKKIIIDRLKTM